MGKKTLIAFLFVLAIAACGQRVLFKVHSGHQWIPDGWPSEGPVSVGTNTSIPPGWFSNVTFQQFIDYRSNRLAQYLVAESNELAAIQAPLDSKRAAAIQLFQQMKAYRDFVAVSNPSAAQVSAQVEKLTKAMIALKQPLLDLYRPEQDE